jgi:hypothetical protein
MGAVLGAPTVQHAGVVIDAYYEYSTLGVRPAAGDGAWPCMCVCSELETSTESAVCGRSWQRRRRQQRPAGLIVAKDENPSLFSNDLFTII